MLEFLTKMFVAAAVLCWIGVASLFLAVAYTPTNTTPAESISTLTPGY